jgi:glucose/arabinose dehydrogenase
MTTEKRRPRARRRALGALAASAAIALAGVGAYAATAPSGAVGAEGDFHAQALPGVAFKAPRIIIRGDVTTTGAAIPASTPGTIVPGFGVFDPLTSTGTVPTSIAISPVKVGGKKQLYVATQYGKIFVFSLDAQHNATLVNTIDSIYTTPNQSFNGTTPKPKLGRQTTGIVFAPANKQPADGNVILYVSNSDPDIFDEAEPGQSKVNPSSGRISRLIVSPAGQVLQRIDIITGLPRSGENHSTNGMAFGPDGWLYIGQAGNTNGGGQSKPFAWFPEVPLGSSVLRANVDKILAMPGSSIDVSVGSRFNFIHPCGGGTVPNGCTAEYTLTGSPQNNGTKPGVFEIYATGFRNPYDMLWHTNGKLYLNENEGNPGIGPKPGSSANNPTAPCGPLPAGDLGEVGFHADQLFQVKQGQYHGHPNPSRGECIHEGGVQPIGNYFFAAASTGIAEYTPFNFGPALQGQLLTTNYGVTPGGGNGDTISRVKLSADGNSVVEIDNQFLTGFNDPLDVIVDDDGTVIVAEHGFKNGNFGKISVLDPLSNFVCPAPGDPAAIDSDGDGFKDADETAAGTDKCMPASSPPDADGDKIADASDPDDDNDGIPDVSDKFQLDATNGAGTKLPFVQDFIGSANGGYGGSGLTGAMLSSKGGGPKPGNVSAGAAGGYLGIGATAGTAQGASNNQENALQQGFKPVAPATVSAIVGQPFGTSPNPQGGELAGIFIGPGEDDFVRLSVNANNGTPVVELAKEENGKFERLATAPVSLPQSSVRLFIDLDPGTDAVKARFQIGTGEVQNLGAAFAVPGSWLDTVAAGVMTTTAGSPKASVGFIYDEFRIENGVAIPKPPNPGPGNNTTDQPRGIKVINGQVCRAVPAPARLRVGKIKLSAGQMLATQRVSQTALRRLAAIEARLDGKLKAGDICGGAITADLLNKGIQTATGATNELVASDPARIPNPKVTKSRAKVRLNAKQLLINQRVAQAAVLRAAAIEARLRAGLTGGDLKPGVIGPGQLAQGLRIVSARQSGKAAKATRTRVARGSSGSAANIKVNRKQLEINHKIALAALRRTNLLAARLETGLLRGDFKRGSIGVANLDPSLRS